MMPGAAALAINQVQLWNECNKMAIFGGAGGMRFSCYFIKRFRYFMFRTGCQMRYMLLL